MRKFFGVALAVAGAFLFVPAAHAQFTTVTATVKDPNGIPYAGGTMSAVLVPGSPGGYTLSGAPYSGRVGPVTLDGTGKFIANFGDVTLISPGSPQWQITIDSNQGGIEAPLGTGGQTFTFTSTGTTISGSSPVDISTSLNALAPKLANITIGGGSVTSITATGPIVVTPSPLVATGVISCPTCNTSSATIAGTIAATQVAFGSGANTIAGSANLTYASSIFNVQSAACPLTSILTFTACGNNAGLGLGPVEIIQTSTTPPNGCGLVMSNSNSTGNTGSTRVIYTCFDQTTSGGFAMGQTFASGATGALNFVGTGGTQGNMEIGTNLANGTDFVQFFTNNDGTSGLTSTNGGAVSFPPILNLLNTASISAILTFNGGSSGHAAISVPAVAGTPCTILLPITSATVGQVLSSAAPSGGNCQTSWSTPSTVATAVPLSGITAATGSNTIASGNNPQTWNWALTTDAIDAMAIGETSAATNGTLTNGLANQAIFMVATATNSTATPFEIVQGSITNTVATPLAQFEATWNNAGLAAIGLLMNVTNTASAASSLLADIRVGNVSQFNLTPVGAGTFLTSVATGTSPPNCLPGTGGVFCANEGTAATPVAAIDQMYADSTTHNYMMQLNGGGPRLIHSTAPNPIHSVGNVAAISTATLCTAGLGNCNPPGMYNVRWAFTQTGTACGTPGTGGVTFLLTWTDFNGTSHSATQLSMDDSLSLVATTGTFHFTTNNATAWATGDFNLSSNGSIIQYATGYTACSVGTGTYELDAAVTRLE